MAASKIFLVDSHAHLNFAGLKEQQEAIINRAKRAGVGVILSIGTHPDEWEQVLEIAEKNDAVWATVGLHPCDTSGFEAGVLLEKIRAYIGHDKVVGLGETGLDCFHKPFDQHQQEMCFAQHMKVGLEAKLPLIIHARDAEGAMLKNLSPFMAQGGKCVMHSFTGSAAFAEACIAMGCYISFSGILTFKNAKALKEVAKKLPLNRLLVETDAPYLAPEPNRGKPNEPAYVRHTAQCLADLLQISLEEIAQITTENFFRLFPKVKPS